MSNYHHQLLEMMDDGTISAEWLAGRALAWLGEHDIEQMIKEQPDFRELNLFGLEDDEEE